MISISLWLLIYCICSVFIKSSLNEPPQSLLMLLQKIFVPMTVHVHVYNVYVCVCLGACVYVCVSMPQLSATGPGGTSGAHTHKLRGMVSPPASS